MGIGLGEYLARAAGLSWTVSTDEYGTELALHGQPGDILMFPLNAVSKRWAEGTIGFIVDFAGQTLASVENIRAR